MFEHLHAGKTVGKADCSGLQCPQLVSVLIIFQSAFAAMYPLSFMKLILTVPFDVEDAGLRELILIHVHPFNHSIISQRR